MGGTDNKILLGASVNNNQNETLVPLSFLTAVLVEEAEWLNIFYTCQTIVFARMVNTAGVVSSHLIRHDLLAQTVSQRRPSNSYSFPRGAAVDNSAR